MTAGIEIRRDDTGIVPAGSLVLTTNKRNPILVASGTTATVSSGATYASGTGGGSLLQLSVVCPHDSIPALVSDPAMCSYNSSWDSGTGTWIWQYISTAVPGTNIDWMVFAEKPLTAATMGIELYADDGTLQFALHPNNKPLRVVDVLNGAYTSSVSYPAGRTYALAHGKHSGKLIWEQPAKPSTFALPDPTYFMELWWGVFASMVGSDFFAGQIRLDPGPETFVGTNTPDYTLERDWTDLDHMVIDVTGY